MKWIARVFVFTAALGFGSFAGSLFATDTAASTLTAASLVGTWEGNFGRDLGACTIEITRSEGDFLNGTLEKEGYLIRFEGYFNPNTRKLYIEETSILRTAAHMGEWSLGRNSAIVAADGRTLTGDGYDKWGEYDWYASK
jgi:hypothetical protein